MAIFFITFAQNKNRIRFNGACELDVLDHIKPSFDAAVAMWRRDQCSVLSDAKLFGTELVFKKRLRLLTLTRRQTSGIDRLRMSTGLPSYANCEKNTNGSRTRSKFIGGYF